MTTTETIQQTENIVWATEDGIIEFKRLLEKQEKQAVRLGIQGGGCNGYSYYMDFDDPKEGDEVVQQEGISFVIDQKSLEYLKGLKIDYSDGLQGKGFVFQNPNASDSCSCGDSFSC
jgi:iron-sulfur cluster assembly protein